MILAGDIGGTKTLLGLFDAKAPLPQRKKQVRERTSGGSVAQGLAAVIVSPPICISVGAMLGSSGW